jgi:hypothetical protein
MTVTDHGNRIAVGWSGRNWEGDEIVAHAFEFAVAAGSPTGR